MPTLVTPATMDSADRCKGTIMMGVNSYILSKNG
jgi:hypothetical protein